jgi:hypothetical protein
MSARDTPSTADSNEVAATPGSADRTLAIAQPQRIFDMNLLVQPVVMAGGSGTRLWPLSRAGHPKQFLALSGHTSLFQQAVARIQGLATSGQTLLAPLIVGNEDHCFLVLDQMREARIAPAAVLLEPCHPRGQRRPGAGRHRR